MKPNGDPLEKFNPYGYVTRAEFATVLSRLLYGERYENMNGVWYERHIEALKEHNILRSNLDPHMKELRGYIMLMLMRSEKNK